MELFEKRIDLSFLTEFEKLTVEKLLEMDLNASEEDNHAQANQKTIRRLRRSGKCTRDDVNHIQAAISGFLDWCGESPPPLAAPFVPCALSAQRKIREMGG